MMFTVIDAQMARQRYNDMLQEAERERRFADLPTVRVNLLENAINAFKVAFAQRTQPKRATVRPAIAVK